MVFCGESNCQIEFTNGRQRRRHVHKVHRPLPYICTSCNNEPFLSQRALDQHCSDGHIKKRTRPRLSRTKGTAVPSTVMTPMISSGIYDTTGLSNQLSRARIFDHVHVPTRSSIAKSRLGELKTETELNSFIASTIQPDSAYLSACGRAVDKVATVLEHNVSQKLRPSRVIKGGSLYKGTAVLRKSDVDLDVMLAEYKDVESLVKDMPRLLDELKRYLQQHDNIRVTGTTHRCVKVEITESGHKIEADVLPAVDLLRRWTPSDVFAMMKNENDRMRGYYSPCIVPLQKQLFENVPTKVKSLIRILKYWKKEVLQVERRATKWPASYALELLALDTWRQMDQTESFNMINALKRVLQNLEQHRYFRISFPRHGSRVEAFYDIGDFRSGYDRVPYIMDPCNPFNNVYYKGAYDWEATATKAREWLRQPLFH